MPAYQQPPDGNGGAGLREVMARMGRASTRAALVYLHGTHDRPRVIAVSDLASKEPDQFATQSGSGTAEGSGT